MLGKAHQNKRGDRGDHANSSDHQLGSAHARMLTAEGRPLTGNAILRQHVTTSDDLSRGTWSVASVTLTSRREFPVSERSECAGRGRCVLVSLQGADLGGCTSQRIR